MKIFNPKSITGRGGSYRFKSDKSNISSTTTTEPLNPTKLQEPLNPINVNSKISSTDYVEKQLHQQGFKVEKDSQGRIQRAFKSPVKYTVHSKWRSGKDKDKKYDTYIPHEIIYSNGVPIKEVKRDSYYDYYERKPGFKKITSKVYDSEVTTFDSQGNVKRKVQYDNAMIYKDNSVKKKKIYEKRVWDYDKNTYSKGNRPIKNEYSYKEILPEGLLKFKDTSGKTIYGIKHQGETIWRNSLDSLNNFIKLKNKEIENYNKKILNKSPIKKEIPKENVITNKSSVLNKLSSQIDRYFTKKEWNSLKPNTKIALSKLLVNPNYYDNLSVKISNDEHKFANIIKGKMILNRPVSEEERKYYNKYSWKMRFNKENKSKVEEIENLSKDYDGLKLLNEKKLLEVDEKIKPYFDISPSMGQELSDLKYSKDFRELNKKNKDNSFQDSIIAGKEMISNIGVKEGLQMGTYTGALSALDKASNKYWKKLPFGTGYAVKPGQIIDMGVALPSFVKAIFMPTPYTKAEAGIETVDILSDYIPWGRGVYIKGSNIMKFKSPFSFKIPEFKIDPNIKGKVNYSNINGRTSSDLEQFIPDVKEGFMNIAHHMDTKDTPIVITTWSKLRFGDRIKRDWKLYPNGDTVEILTFKDKKQVSKVNKNGTVNVKFYDKGKLFVEKNLKNSNNLDFDKKPIVLGKIVEESRVENQEGLVNTIPGQAATVSTYTINQINNMDVEGFLDKNYLFRDKLAIDTKILKKVDIEAMSDLLFRNSLHFVDKKGINILENEKKLIKLKITNYIVNWNKGLNTDSVVVPSVKSINKDFTENFQEQFLKLVYPKVTTYLSKQSINQNITPIHIDSKFKGDIKDKITAEVNTGKLNNFIYMSKSDYKKQFGNEFDAHYDVSSNTIYSSTLNPFILAHEFVHYKRFTNKLLGKSRLKEYIKEVVYDKPYLLRKEEKIAYDKKTNELVNKGFIIPVKDKMLFKDKKVEPLNRTKFVDNWVNKYEKKLNKLDKVKYNKLLKNWNLKEKEINNYYKNAKHKSLIQEYDISPEIIEYDTKDIHIKEPELINFNFKEGQRFEVINRVNERLKNNMYDIVNSKNLLNNKINNKIKDKIKSNINERIKDTVKLLNNVKLNNKLDVKTKLKLKQRLEQSIIEMNFLFNNQIDTNVNIDTNFNPNFNFNFNSNLKGNKKDKNQQRKNTIKKDSGYKLSRLQDPYYRLLGESKYSDIMNKMYRDRYGNFYA